MQELISQSEARAKGLPRYFTGKPCVRGHRSERPVRGGRCLACKVEDDAYRIAHGLDKENRRKWRINNSEKVKVRSAKKHLKKYSLDFETLSEMMYDQSGCCLICLDPMVEPCVDHCHSTGKVRGLLCRQSNAGIGLLKDDPERLLRAAAYIRDSS